MTGQINADWYRLVRATPIWWCLCALSLICGLVPVLFSLPGASVEDASMGAAPIIMGCLCMLFCASFDHVLTSDGVIRLRVVPTGAKARPWISSLVVEILASLILLALFHIPYMAAIAMGHLTPPEEAGYMGVSVTSAILFTVFMVAAYHTIGMECSSQVVSLLLCAVLLVCILIVPTQLVMDLNEPETVPVYEVGLSEEGDWGEDLDFDALPREANPLYVPRSARAAYDAWIQALPGTAVLRELPDGLDHADCWPVWVLEGAAIMAAGALAFRRRNLN